MSNLIVETRYGKVQITQVRHRGMRSPFALVFGLEALCLLVFLLLGPHALQGGVIRPSPSGIFSVYVVLLILAMGLQTATLRRAGSLGMRTTFVTGVLSDWVQALTQYLSWWRKQPGEQHVRQTMRKSMQQASFRHLLLLAGIWICYVLGVICASALELHMALSALIFPLFVLAALIVLDVFRPLQQPEASISHR